MIHNASIAMPGATPARTALALGLLLAAFSCLPIPGRAAAGGGSTATPVEAVEVSVAPVTVEVRTVGTLRADESVVIRPEIAGRVLQVHFAEGQAVQAGQELITLDPAEYRAQLAESSATLRLHQLNFDRAQDLFKKKLMSQQEFDEAIARLAQSEARQVLD
jgi:membrane fusion protein, multidrug efflux system